MEKQTSLAMIQKCLTSIGYEESAIETHYEFQVGPNIRTADLVAFADGYRKDIQSSCIAVKFCENERNIHEISSELKYIAAPIAFIPTPSSIHILPLTQKGTDKGHNYSYDTFESYIQHNRYSFLPTALQAIKIDGRQLSLFELDPSLYAFVSKITQKQLVERFEEAIASVDNLVDSKKRETVIKLAIKILTAKILEDKGIIGTNKAASAVELIQKSSFKFKNYFNPKEVLQYQDIADKILISLGNDVTFKMITNEDLGYFYEHTFVSDEHRKLLGIYYTPQKIAYNMLLSLPVEDIHPDDRIVLDGTCGSGSLLTAAYSKLHGLLPLTMNGREKHDYLTERLHGVDRDPFAVEVAKKSLLMASLPFGNSWDITSDDFIKAATDFNFSPTIIVANPPFKEKRELKLEQQATQFLEIYLKILRDDGLISIVLPESFLQNQSCRNARHSLLNSLELIEMWHLPEGAFPMAQFSTVVITGKKKNDKNRRLVRVRRLMRKGSVHDTDTKTIDFDKNYISFIEPKGSECEIITSSFDEIWKQLGSKKIGDFFEIKNGIIPGHQGQQNIKKKAALGLKKFLNSARLLRPYKINWIDSPEYVEYPGQLQWPRELIESFLKTPDSKIIVNSARAPVSPWRMSAAIDHEGVYPSRNFHCIIPKVDNNLPLEVLVAILNSPVANAFMDSFNRKRWLLEHKIALIPLPVFTLEQQENIVNCVHTLEQTFSAKDVLKLDDIIFDVYGIYGVQKEAIIQHVIDFRRPGFDDKTTYCAKKLSSKVGDTYKVAGKILSVDSDKGAVQLMLLSSEDDVTIPIPDSLPGWALEEGRSFEATIPACQKNLNPHEMDFLSFHLLPTSYAKLSTNDLEKLFFGERTLHD